MLVTGHAVTPYYIIVDRMKRSSLAACLVFFTATVEPWYSFIILPSGFYIFLYRIYNISRILGVEHLECIVQKRKDTVMPKQDRSDLASYNQNTILHKNFGTSIICLAAADGVFDFSLTQGV